MSQRLLIVGASTRAAAVSGHRAGFRIVTADLFADIDLAGIADPAIRIGDYPAEFENVLASQSYDHWMATGALENYPDFIEEWSERFPGYCGCSPSAIRMARSDDWRSALRRAGFAVPCQSPLPPHAADTRQWLYKHRRSAGGARVQANHMVVDGASDPGAFFQERIIGTPMSAVYVASDSGCELIGITEQLIGRDWGGPFEFSYVGSVGPLLGRESHFEQWLNIGKCVAHECGLRGVFGIDAIDSAGELVSIEVNPRFTASAELFERSGVVRSVTQLHIEACHNEGPVSVQHSRNAVAPMQGKAILWAKSNVTVSDSLSVKLLDLATGSKAEIADVPRPGVITDRQPIATVFAEGRDQKQTKQNLLSRLRSIRQLCGEG